ncbi:TIGR02099 family protein [Pseudomonas sp. gcc21]|uniref:YhdP family protein n=1 Tax=Pseudomonas sp. gcc21 TaxID=2726989 RepID=UPI001451289D|nr:YhdP family protein [Pseudomonas sp. gcc21]QJD60343.1 TIGR02099 family protein [Pseudomonas sp. gcc21]
MSWQTWVRRGLDGLILCLVIWLLATAAYVSLGRQFVPAVADYQAELVKHAEELTGRAIRLDNLSGEMQGTQPVFMLRGLQVHAEADPDSSILFALDNVTARLDVFASLWRREPVLDALQVEGLALELLEEADGRWRLRGLGSRDRVEGGLDETLGKLLNQRRITLLDSRIRINPHNLPEWNFTDGDLTLVNRWGDHQFDARLALPDGRQLRLKLEGQSEGDNWRDMSVEFFAELPAMQWSDWIPHAWLEQVRLEQLVAGGDFWGSWQARRLHRLQGVVDAPEVTLRTLRPGAALTELQAQFDLQLGTDQQSLRVEQLGLQVGDIPWPETRLTATRTVEDGSWQLALDRLPLEPLAAGLHGSIPQDRFADILAALDPQGALIGVGLRGSSTSFALDDLTLEARLENISVEPWRAVPGFRGISGTLAGSRALGELRLDSYNWSMSLPQLFPEPWQYDHLTGSLSWEWSDESGMRLKASSLAVSGEEGEATARLDLHLPRPGGTPSMDLRVALRDSQAEFYRRYLPSRAAAMSPQLHEWLLSTDLSGNVPLAIFSYRGVLAQGAAPEDRVLELYGSIDQGSLFFQPGWPALENVSGTLHLRNTAVTVQQGQARLWNTELSDVNVAIDREVPDAPMLLSVNGDVTGPLQDALRLMQDTPLSEITSDPLAGWTGNGTLAGTGSLVIPLQQGGQPDIRLKAQARAEQLFIPQLDAPLHEVSGNFAYDHSKGLTADSVHLQFLGEPVTGTIGVIDREQLIRMKGSHPVQALKSWSMLSKAPLQLATGRVDWDAQVAIRSGSQSVQVASDLQGVALDLPQPFAKQSEQALPTEVTLRLTDQGQRWSFRSGGDLRGVVVRSGDSLRGDVRYRSGNPAVPSEQGLSVRANFADLKWNDWQQWISDFRTGTGTGTAAQSPAASDSPLAAIREINLNAARFEGLGLELDDLQLYGRNAPAGWGFDVQQTDVVGRIRLPAGANEPLQIDLQRLRFARDPNVAEESEALVEPMVSEDPLDGVTPSSLPAINLSVAQLFWGEDLVGPVSFRMRPTAQGLRVDDANVALRGGLQLRGNLNWRDVDRRTRFEGSLSADNVGEVLRAWDYAPTLTSNEFAATTELEWPGSPAYFALKRSTGQLQLRARDGVLQSGESSADALKVFGLLNFNALTRRLRLDFSDLFGKGTAYDTLDGDLLFTDGVMHNRTPLVMDGPSVKLQLDGRLDLPQNEIDMGMLVTLPVTNNLPLAAIIAGAPYIGGALFIADKILGDRIARFASVKYKISGDWQKPNVEFDRAFDNEAALED